MQHTQTAPQTFIAAAANATHRLFAGAAVAIRALHGASAERMRLGLEHLRRVRKPQALPAPEPTYEMRVQDLIDAYADPALHPDIERIARAIASKAYRNGYCYATQEKIAAWTGIARSTLQLRLHEMERLHLSHVERRLKTSSITLLADGTLDALRLKKINKIKVRERTAPYVVRTFTAPTTTNPHETDIRFSQNLDSWPKNTTCSQQSKSSNKSEYRSRTVVSTNSSQIESLSRESKQVNKRANESKKKKTEKMPIESSENVKNSGTDNEVKPHKKPVTKNIKAEQTAVQNNNETQKETAAKTINAERTTPQNGKEEKKKAVAPSVSSHPEHIAAAALLIAEGVTPARARSFAAIFEPEHIERTIAVGLHRTKNNPPAYLLRLIQDDAASKRIVPGSEADQVRQRERSGALRGRIGPVKAPEAQDPVPSAVSSVQPKQRALEAICGTFSGWSEPPPEVMDPLDALSPEDRDRYARRAREEVLRAKPWLGEGARTSNGPLMQAMIREQLRAMLATTEAPASRGAPSG